jgi:tetratricopeptide (TPR) repeat protein
MAAESAEERARALFQQAYEHQMKGELERAEALYKESIQLFPTAEAFTFLGWTYSFMGLYDRAIEECLRAIEVDPDFGNPYNDIGSYLIQKGELEEAIPWLEKATRAKRYEARAFPYVNLARVYEAWHDYRRALEHYKRALREQPDYRPALKGVRRIQAMMN